VGVKKEDRPRCPFAIRYSFFNKAAYLVTCGFAVISRDRISKAKAHQVIASPAISDKQYKCDVNSLEKFNTLNMTDVHLQASMVRKDHSSLPKKNALPKGRSRKH
jgi:hypothetical protein